MMRKTIYRTVIALAALTASRGVQAQTNILEIDDNTLQSTVIYPESFETDTRKMLENWYLRNYAVLDTEADERKSIPAGESEIIERLRSLPTVIEMPYNSLVKNIIDFYVNRRKQLVENMIGMSLYYMPIFEQALDRNGLPMELKYLPVIESALNPTAVSRAGATGLWQFMLSTATGLGLEVNSLVDQRKDPYASSEAAALYLKQLYQTFGDWSLAIAAYNCGPGNVNKALRRAGGGKKDFWEIYPFLPTETRGYVPAFIAANYVMNHFDKHNISPALARRPIITDTVHVGKRVHFNQISAVLGIPVEEIRALNPQYRTDLIPGDIHPYSLVLPSMQVYAYIASEDSILNHDAALYARRDVVEPSDGTVTGKDSKGEYIEEVTTKYHKVAKGENLAKIAKKYGVTISSIRKANKIGKKVRRGQRLKINTVTRRYIETAQPDTSMIAASSDSIVAPRPAQVNDAVADSISTSQAEVVVTDSTIVEQSEVSKPVVEKKPKVQKAKNETKKKSTTTTYKVRNGDTLSKIAKRHGVTVKALKKANGMTSDNIRKDQKLKIPSK